MAMAMCCAYRLPDPSASASRPDRRWWRMAVASRRDLSCPDGRGADYAGAGLLLLGRMPYRSRCGIALRPRLLAMLPCRRMLLSAAATLRLQKDPATLLLWGTD